MSFKQKIKSEYISVDQEEMNNIMSKIELVKQGDVESPSIFLDK